jgi:hypothetical protein
MSDLCKLIFGMVIDLLRSRATLEAEILLLRQQINVLRRCPYRKSNPEVLMVQSAENGPRLNIPKSLNSTPNRCILAQG